LLVKRLLAREKRIQTPPSGLMKINNKFKQACKKATKEIKRLAKTGYPVEELGLNRYLQNKRTHK